MAKHHEGDDEHQHVGDAERHSHVTKHAFGDRREQRWRAGYLDGEAFLRVSVRNLEQAFVDASRVAFVHELRADDQHRMPPLGADYLTYERRARKHPFA